MTFARAFSCAISPGVFSCQCLALVISAGACVKLRLAGRSESSPTDQAALR